MKKLLSVALAIMMVFGAFAVAAVPASAQTVVIPLSDGTKINYEIPDDKILIGLNFLDATSQVAIETFDFTTASKITQVVEGGWAYLLVDAGAPYNLPVAVAKSGKMVTGWQLSGGSTSNLLGNGAMVQTQTDEGGSFQQYLVSIVSTEPETDTLDTIKSILVKVFGIIVGLFLGDTTHGQEIVANLFDSVFA